MQSSFNGDVVDYHMSRIAEKIKLPIKQFISNFFLKETFQLFRQVDFQLNRVRFVVNSRFACASPVMIKY